MTELNHVTDSPAPPHVALSSRSSVGPMLVTDTRSLRHFRYRRSFFLGGLALVQLGLALALLIVSIQQHVRVTHHRIPVNLQLVSSSALSDYVGGWPQWQSLTRIALAACFVAFTLCAVAANMVDARLSARVAIVPPSLGHLHRACQVALAHFVTALSLFLLIVDARAVVMTHTQSVQDLSLTHLPQIGCCGVRMDPDWVSGLILASGGCYGSTTLPQYACTGASTGLVIPYPDDLRDFTCDRVACSRGDYEVVCILDGVLLLFGLLALLGVLYWYRRLRSCEHCHKVLAPSALGPHHCRYAPCFTCPFCGVTLREVDSQAHLHQCREERMLLQMQGGPQVSPPAKRTRFPPQPALEIRMPSPSRPPRGPMMTPPRNAPPALKGGWRQFSVDFPSSDDTSYLKSQSLLLPPPPVALAASSSSSAATAPPAPDDTSKLCPYCGDPSWPIRRAEHLSRHCTHYFISCTHCARSVVFKERHQHEACCPQRPLACQFCAETVLQQDLPHHEEHDCKWRDVQCSVCSSVICFQDFDSHSAKCQPSGLPR